MKKLRYSVLAFIMAGCFSMSSLAADNLLISFTGGHKQSISLNDYPLIIINEGMLNIQTHFVTFKYDINSVNGFKYVDDSGIQDIGVTETFKIDNGNIILKAECDDIDMRMYDLKGVLVKSCTISKGTNQSLSLTDMTSGVYVIKINEMSIKIAR